MNPRTPKPSDFVEQHPEDSIEKELTVGPWRKPVKPPKESLGKRRHDGALEIADQIMAMNPGDKIIVERHADEPGKNLYTYTVKNSGPHPTDDQQRLDDLMEIVDKADESLKQDNPPKIGGGLINEPCCKVSD